MKIIEKLIVSLILICSFVVADEEKSFVESYIEPNFYTFNISINYLDWTAGTQERSLQKDFSYVELEGFAKWDWGEFYMFADLENPTKNYADRIPDSKRYVFKPVLDIKLFDTPFHIHIQDYMFYSDEYYVNNLVIGLSYKIETNFGFWMKPFIGPHIQTSTYYNGNNGYIAGWVFGYDFDLLDEKFSLSQWHEHEWDRDRGHYLLDNGMPIGDGESSGVQGAFCVWWHPIDEITTGIQYRYANNKLGFQGYQAGFIYSLKYNF